MTEIERLQQAIAALEAQRDLLGEAVVEAGLAPMRERLRTLQSRAAQQQRKQVSILFADASGFTSLSERVDAEDVTETMNRLWQLVDGVIVSFGGRIDKHIGDAVMAVWGMETAAENDAEQALRAALRMQHDVQQAGLCLGGAPLQLRVAVHSGAAFLSSIGAAGEYTVMGDTVNTASRLQHVAPVGSVILSAETYELVRGIFNVQLLPPVLLEGKSEPVQAYLALSPKPRAFRMGTRGLEGIHTRMVGRAAELNALQTAFEAIVHGAPTQCLTVVGDAGIGKSRLLFEFENWLELKTFSIRFFKGRASPEMQHLPYALLRDVFAFRFQIRETDTPAVARQKFEEGICAEFAEQGMMRAHWIGQFLGFDFSGSPYLQGLDAQQLRNRAVTALQEFLSAAANRPLVLFFEDIHWADDSSLALLTALFTAPPSIPLLVVCLTRPTLFERAPQWGSDWAQHQFLRLQALSREESRTLVTEILQRAVEVPEALRELVVGGAEGNPYYLEELIKMLIEDGVILKGEVQWQINPARLMQVRVPRTLAGVLQARLDSLTPDERRCLQQASVLGRVFWDGALAHLAQTEVGLAEALHSLEQRELIFKRPNTAFGGCVEYTFKHALLRDVTYESVLKRERRGYHARAAEWLQSNGGERSREYIGLMAQHLELAGDLERAAVLLKQAGEQAAQQFANAEALQALHHALELTNPQNRRQRFEIGMAVENVLNLVGQRAAEVEEALAQLQTLAEEMEDPSAQSAAALRLSHFAEINGDYPRAIQAADFAVQQGQLAGNPALLAEGYLLWGRGLWRQGRLEDAVERLQQALAAARPADVLPVQAGALRTLGAIRFHQGDYSEVQVIYQQALQLYERIGDRRGYGSALNNLGDIARQQGGYTQACEYFQRSLQISREIGERWSENIALLNLALVCFVLESYAEGLEYATQARRLAEEANYRSALGFALTGQGNCLTGLGRYEEAEAALQACVQMRSEMGEFNTCMETRAGLARLYLAQGKLALALQQVEEILAYLQNNSLNGTDEPFRIYWTCCEVLKKAGDVRRGPLLNQARQLLLQQADRMQDPALRRSFLENVTIHARLLAMAQAAT